MRIPDWAKYSLGLLLIFLMFAGAVFINKDAEFGGADNAGRDAIAGISPDYVPWFEPFWSPKPETESMLFALQAAIGAGVLGYFVGHEVARMRYERKKGRE